MGRFAKDGERMPSLVALFADLIHVVDTLCPPPKAPLSDEEIECIVSWLAAGVGTTEALVEAKTVIDSLRARGAK